MRSIDLLPRRTLPVRAPHQRRDPHPPLRQRLGMTAGAALLVCALAGLPAAATAQATPVATPAPPVLPAGLAAPGAAGAPPAAAAAADATVTQPRRVTSVEGVTEYRLPNGLQLLLVPDDSKPSTTVNITYRVGSRHENYGETGMAHLLEHLIFKGTPTTRNVWGEFARRGLRANGSTSFDRTNYFASFSARDETLRWYLGWLADGMVNSLIARSDLDSEMTVVRNEMESGENNPFRVTLQKTMATMFQWHNYGKSTIGARADVENVDIERLQAFYRRHYQPDNATLVVSGRFDSAQVLAWVGELFGPLPRPQRVLPPTYTLDPAQDGERSVTVRRPGGTPLLIAGWHGVPAGHPDHAALELLATVMGSEPAGRLHQKLVGGGLAASVFGFSWGLAEPGPLFLGATLAPGQEPAKARAALLAEVGALAQRPLTAAEVERARTQWLNDWDKGFADPEQVGVQLSEAIGAGDWRLHFLIRDRVRAVSVAEVQRVAQAYLKPDNLTVGSYLPTDKPDRAPAPAFADLSALKDYRGDVQGAQTEAFDATPANLDARTVTGALASGLKVALLPKASRGNQVQARLTLRFGDERSLMGQGTAVGMLGALLDKGGAGMDKVQVSDAFDRLKAQVGFSAGGQALTVALVTQREHLPDLVRLLGRLLREPALGAEALDEQRRQWLASLASQRSEPGALASQAAARHGNPYPRGDLRHVPSFDETEAELRALTPQAVRAVHRRFISAAAGEFSAAGAMDVPAVQRALDEAFGTWSQPAEGPRPYVRAPQPLVQPSPLVQRIATPDKANATFVLRLPMPINDTHPDYPALLVANQLLGQGGQSRLWRRIREQDGLSYDVRSGVAWSNHEPASTWQASAIFAPQNRDKVEQAFREELRRALDEGFSAEELDQVRPGILSQRRLARAQDGVVAAVLGSNQFLGRRYALQQQVDDAIGALTLAQVNEALRRYIDPARAVWVWAGDFDKPARP